MVANKTNQCSANIAFLIPDSLSKMWMRQLGQARTFTATSRNSRQHSMRQFFLTETDIDTRWQVSESTAMACHNASVSNAAQENASLSRNAAQKRSVWSWICWPAVTYRGRSAAARMAPSSAPQAACLTLKVSGILKLNSVAWDSIEFLCLLCQLRSTLLY